MNAESFWLDLFEELGVAAAWLGAEGEVCATNAAAGLLLQGHDAERLQRELRTLCDHVRQGSRYVESALKLPEWGAVRAAVARPGPDGSFVAVVERNRLAETRAEVAVLRTLLETISRPHTPNLYRSALTQVAQVLDGGHLALFEPEGDTLACRTHTAMPETFLPCFVPQRLDASESVVSRAYRLGRIVSVGGEPPPPGALFPESQTGPCLAVALPISSGERRFGVLYAAVRRAGLSGGQLRLIQALADALALARGQDSDRAALIAEQAAEQRALEVAMQRDRMAMVGELVSGVAHEIRNPLSYLGGNLGFLQEGIDKLVSEGLTPEARAETVEDLRSLVHDCKHGVEKIREIAEALQTSARQRPKEQVHFDPVVAIQQAITLFRGAARACRLETALAPVPQVLGTPGALGQVIVNLLQNGLDAMDGKGTLRVVTRATETHVEISVSDQGTGIPEAIAATIFEPFFTTKEVGKGTGLGLPISKRIIEEMGGALGYETGPAGTTFTVLLPIPEG